MNGCLEVQERGELLIIATTVYYISISILLYSFVRWNHWDIAFSNYRNIYHECRNLFGVHENIYAARSTLYALLETKVKTSQYGYRFDYLYPVAVRASPPRERKQRKP